MSKKTLNVLTIKERLKIIKEVENGKKKIDVAKEFKISPSTITVILKNRGKLLEKSISSENLNLKKIRNCGSKDLENSVLTFVQQARLNNLPLSGTIIKEKAKTFAAKLGVNGFKASDGWLTKFKRKHQMKFKTISGESAAVDQELVGLWKEQLPSILIDFDADDIFNLDETALFFKCLPNKTLTFRNDRCFGGKFSKERVTVLVGSNASGTEKLPLLVIGKSKNPRCFRNVRSLPVLYKSNKKAWMTGEIFSSYMKDLDEKFLTQNRSVLFFADNCAAHSKELITSLRAIKLVFFPPNMTSVVQPMDAGIIKNLKTVYRKRLVTGMLDELENSGNFTTPSLLDGIKLIATSWEQVTPRTIANCFVHVGIVSHWNQEDNIPLANLANQSHNSIEPIPMENDEVVEDTSLDNSWLQCYNDEWVPFQEYVDCDTNVLIEPILNDEEIVSFITNQDDESENEEVPERSENISLVVPSLQQTKEALQIIYNKLLNSVNVPADMFSSYSKLDNFINKR